MGLKSLIMPFPWGRYSKKLISRMDQMRNAGYFTPEEAEARVMRLATGEAGNVAEGNKVYLYWLVDKDDGIIVDARYQVFGPAVLIGVADTSCDLLVGKNYDQASRITADLIDRHVRDRADDQAFPREAYSYLNLILEAIEHAVEKCTDIPFIASYSAPPVPTEIQGVLENGYPGWLEMPLQQKIALIEDVLDKEIRPYIALDAGGVEVIRLVNDRELFIKYQGSCTSCYSSIGATLSAIQSMIRAKVHPSIVVIPE